MKNFPYFQNDCTRGLDYGDQRFQDVVDYITSKLGHTRLLVFKSKTDNACATYYDYDTPIITYNPDFIYRIEQQSWPAVIAIFTHEIIHHYNQDLHRPADNSFWAQFIIDLDSHRAELNADMFAGWILQKEGFSLSQALEVYEVYDFSFSKTHPFEYQRRQAMKDGWMAAYNGNGVRKKEGVSSSALGGVLLGAGLFALCFGLLASIDD